MSSRSSRSTTTTSARLAAQGLVEPLPDAVAVCERLLAVQAQDPRGFRLAVRARTRGLVASDVDAALDRGELVVDWLCRGTLHLVRAEDHGWLHALTTPGLWVGNARRLAQEGVSEAQAGRGVRCIERGLSDGPLGRRELRDVLDRAGVPTAGQALVHLLFAASLRGLIVRGPMRGGQQAFVLRADWLGPAPEVDREAALRELGRRFLAGHGPADERDLAKWAGITLTDARTALPHVEVCASEGDNAASAKLLGAFDPILHGWVDRTPVVGDHLDEIVAGGLFRPFALVDGRAAATWKYERGQARLDAPFTPLTKSAERALARDAKDVERFLAG